MFAPLPKHKAFKHLSSGFTLIELVVVMAILGIFVLIASQTLGLFTQQVNLNTTSQRIVSTLQLARNKTLAAEDESQYGVHFEQSKYTLFKGSTYSSSDPDNKEYSISTTEIYEINLTVGDDIIFDRIRGTTANSGNVKVRLLSDTSRTETILVNSSGSISLLESVSPSCPGMTCPRITDTRHLHFDLGWSILGELDLIFEFPDDSHTETIPMTGFFNGPNEFDWEGKITVNGSDQILRVHTHFLNATNTTLSIHRDGQKNDKAVNISIKSGTEKDIVNYNSAGDAAVQSSGGTVTVQ